MAFEMLPYTNFHDLNLDWILAKVKEMIEAKDTVITSVTAATEAAETATEAAASASENSEIAQSAANDATTAKNNAEISARSAQAALENIGTGTAGAVADWLNAHVDPDTGYVIDDSLSIEGAAADALATGIATGGIYGLWVEHDQSSSLTWEQGTINDSGIEVYINTSLRTTNIFRPETVIPSYILVDNEQLPGYLFTVKYRAVIYDGEGQYVHKTSWHTDPFHVLIPSGYGFRILAEREDGNVISDSDVRAQMYDYSYTDTDLIFGPTITATPGKAADAAEVARLILETRNTIPGLDYTLSLAGMAADAKATGDAIRDMFTGNVEQAVSDWLDAHPEATTTVEDGSITWEKLRRGTLGFVTPQMYGAVGDGVTADDAAINAALENPLVIIPEGTYKLDNYIAIRRSNTTVICLGKMVMSSDFPSAVPGLVIGNQSSNVENVYVYGIDMECSQRIPVEYPNRTGNGIYIRSYVDSHCQHITLDSCKVYNNPRGYGIATGGYFTSDGPVQMNTDILIRNCICDNNYLAFATSCSSATLIYNEGRNSDVENFTCDNFSKDCLFIGNISEYSGNGACSMGGDNCSNCKWIGNIIRYPGETAVIGVSNVGFTFNAEDYRATDCEVIGNTIQGFDRGIWLKNRLTAGYDYSCENSLFIGNVFRDNTYDTYFDTCTGYAVFSDNMYSGQHYVNNDVSSLAWILDWEIILDMGQFLNTGFALAGSGLRHTMRVTGLEVKYNCAIAHSGRANDDVPLIFPAHARPEQAVYQTGFNISAGTVFPTFIVTSGGLHCVGDVYANGTGNANYNGSFTRKI